MSPAEHERGRAGRAVAAADRWWFGPVPATRLAALRIVVGGFALVYLLTRAGVILAVAELPARDFAPVGVVAALGLGPVPGALHQAVVFATLILAVTFTVGVWHRVLAPLFAAGLVWVLSYRCSWGMIFHTENLLALHVIVLALAPAAAVWSIDACGASRSRRARHADHDRRDGRDPPVASAWPVRLMAAVTVLTYVLAGVAKLRVGGLDWLDGESLREQIAVDNVRKVLLGSTMSPVASAALAHAWLFEVLAWATVVVELGAPLALLGRRLALVWSAAAWGFHAGVLVLMAIVFPYPLAFVAYAPLFACERPVGRAGRRLTRLGRRLTSRSVRTSRARPGPAPPAAPRSARAG